MEIGDNTVTVCNCGTMGCHKGLCKHCTEDCKFVNTNDEISWHHTTTCPECEDEETGRLGI